MEDYQAKEQKIINSLIKDLSKELTEDEGYNIESYVEWGPQIRGILFDLVIRKDKFVQAVIDVKQTKGGLGMSKRRLPSFVFTNTTAVLFIVYLSEDNTFTIFSKDKFVLGSSSKSYSVVPSIDGVIKLIRDSSSEHKNKLSEDKNRNLKKEEPEFYEHTERSLKPEWCRKKLKPLEFGKDDELRICRFSTLDSLFSTLRYMKFRMNGLPGMNDKNEGLFAWNIINDPYSMPTDEIKRRKELINNAYIVSFSSEKKIDDLTQWRLYGDDAKGVCCVYTVKKDMIKDRFFLHPVNYIEEPKQGTVVKDGLLQLFINFVQNKSDLDFADLSPAIFFYKPLDYETEDEVRLLVDNKLTSAYKIPQYTREWVLTSANNIPNPYIDIPLQDFPLKLERVILGPNMNDQETVEVQLKTLLKQKGINAIVDPSKIKSYRNRNN